MFRCLKKEATPAVPPDDHAELEREDRGEERTTRLKDYDANIASMQSMHEHLYAVAAASPERARSAAETVQKASAAIAGLYTGVLALIFSVSGTQLPLRGIMAPLFLGLAVVLSTAYLAYFTRKEDRDFPELATGGAYEPMAYKRIRSFIEITSLMAQRRSWMLRGAVLSLGIGLAAIALPFLSGPALAFTTESEKRIESVYPWPSPNPQATSTNEVNLFKAQLDEASYARAKARTNPPVPVDVIGSTEFFFWSTGVGVLIVAVGSGVTGFKTRQ